MFAATLLCFASLTQAAPDRADVIRGGALRPAPPPSPEDQKRTEQMLRQMNGDRKATISWVEGTIRDEKGQPLPGASVYLYFQYYGGRRSYEEVKTTKADDRGRYEFAGPLYPARGTLTVVVAANGRPPTIAHAPGPDAALEKNELKPARLDVTAGSTGASASVKILQDGKALPGVPVRLSAWGKIGVPRPFLAVPEQSPARAEAEALLTPKASTGPDGVARFTNLLPGAFELTAGVAPEFRSLLLMRRGQGSEGVFGTAEGIAAAPGGKIEATIAVHRPLDSVPFRILMPDGSPLGPRTVGFGFRSGQTNAGTLRKFDGQGLGHKDFLDPGLWTVRIRFGDGDATQNQIWNEPFYQAVALIPVSPSFALDEPVTLRATLREPGSVRARLLDAEGKPARGTVTIANDRGDTIPHAATVGADGMARFANLPSGKYRVRGAVEGQPPAPRYYHRDPRPDDAALQGHATVFDRELDLASGAAVSVDLRLEPVGYVRAVIRPPAGRSPSEYTAALESGVPGEESRDHAVDREAGVYVFGPVRSGRWPIVLREKTAVGQAPKRGDRPVEAVPGHVVRVEVTPDPSPPRPKEPKLFDSGPDGFAATVFLADGVTPAFGARALFIPPGERDASAEGIADGSGRLTWTESWNAYESDQTKQGPEPVKEPTIVAWMPGLAGPVVAVPDPDKPLRLVLAAPAGASGRVTFSGAAIHGRDATVRVVAASEGRGALADAFDQEVTADPEGKFRFAGLAPGRYVVQAARDNIWLSRSFALIIEPGKEAAPIDLDIPEPGATMAVKLVDDRNQSVPHLSFAIRRPEGPLAAALAMKYRTDEHGSAVVRGLEVGTQQLVADGDPNPHGFVVPVSRSGAPPQAVRVEVAQPAR